MPVAQIQGTRSTDATVYVALGLAVRTAMVVRCGAGWEARCYYSAEEYHASIATSRESAEAHALAHTIRFAEAGDEHAPD